MQSDKDKFLNDLIAICKKHGKSIEHEDGQGAFIITDINDSAIAWLTDAIDDSSTAENVSTECNTNNKKMIFIPGFGAGGQTAQLVTVLGPHPKIKDGIFIRYAGGGIDTTFAKFLYELPVGHTIVPNNITPENGCKSLLAHEFHVDNEETCYNCEEPNEPDEDCEVCEGRGVYHNKIAITWTTYKAIWDKLIKHFQGG